MKRRFLIMHKFKDKLYQIKPILNGRIPVRPIDDLPKTSTGMTARREAGLRFAGTRSISFSKRKIRYQIWQRWSSLLIQTRGTGNCVKWSNCESQLASGLHCIDKTIEKFCIRRRMTRNIVARHRQLHGVRFQIRHVGVAPSLFEPSYSFSKRRYD